jgi:hypothetical protein
VRWRLRIVIAKCHDMVGLVHYVGGDIAIGNLAKNTFRVIHKLS